MNIELLHSRFVLNSYAGRSLSITHGNGCYLYDDQGNKYLDFMTNYGVNIFGHSHPDITSGLYDQLTKLVTLHGSFSNDIRAKAAKELVQVCGGDAYQVYFSNSGAEAIEAALKFALVVNPKKKIIAFTGSYHGKTLGALSLTSNKNYKLGIEKHLLDIVFLPYNDMNAVDTVDSDTCCVIVEPLQGEGGVIQPDNDFLSKLNKKCRSTNSLFICDEIQTGAGRTGKFLNSHYAQIAPDIVCLGKGLGGGIPIGATIVSKAISARIPKKLQTSTFGGNPLACRGVVETLNLLTPEIYKNIQGMGMYLQDRLRSLDCGVVRGVGLMVGVDVGMNRNRLLKELQLKYVLACPAGETVLRFLPPFNISAQEIDILISVLKKTLKHV